MKTMSWFESCFLEFPTLQARRNPFKREDRKIARVGVCVWGPEARNSFKKKNMSKGSLHAEGAALEKELPNLQGPC